MTLKVIGTGFGRTGTDSMRNALNMLGFGPCHHMYEVMGNPEQTDIWRSIARGATPDWDHVFKGFNSCVSRIRHRQCNRADSRSSCLDRPSVARIAWRILAAGRSTSCG